MLQRVVGAALAGVLVLAGYAALGHAAATRPPTPRPGATATRPAATPTPRPAATEAAPSGKIAVLAREFLYEPKQFTVKAGEVTFAVKNAGVIDHDFVIEDAKNKPIAQANPFAAGKTVEVKVKLAPGAYTIFCSIPGHREAGMSATLKVVP
jgi:uncharacterized cupredoxin-like copper-binding protein